MTLFLRRAGRGRLPDGAILAWSAADGGRGRRWRATVADGEVLRMGLLFEVGSDGRPTRLELASAAGMLTLHPDADGSELHGNVVRRDGVDHLAFGWGPEHDLLAAGLPPLLAVVGRRVAHALPIGEGSVRRAVVVDEGLACAEVEYRLQRLGPGAWRAVLPAGGALDVVIDADGLPAGAGAEAGWPLELG